MSGERRARLWPWVGGPILALIVIWSVGTELPTPECGEGGGASSLEITLFAILVSVAMVVCVAGAGIDLLGQWRRSDPERGLTSRLLGGVLLPLYLLVAALSYLAVFCLVLIGQIGLGC